MRATAWLIVKHKTLAPQQVPLTAQFEERFTIGRVNGNDLVLPFKNISSRAAMLVTRDHWEGVGAGVWIIVPLTTTAVWVNGQRFSHPQVLKDGDKIYIGDCTLLFRQPLPLIHAVRRRGTWITVNEPGSVVFPVLDATSAATGDKAEVRSAVRGAVPLGVAVIDQIDGLTIVGDMAGLWFEQLLAATPAGVRIDPAVLAQVARAALQSLSATTLADTVLSPWLTFDGRVVPMAPTPAVHPGTPKIVLQTLADALMPGLVSVQALAQRCMAEPALSPEHLSGLLANLFPELRATHVRVVEEIGLHGVEGLLRMVAEKDA